jgi:hypothetical protein
MYLYFYLISFSLVGYGLLVSKILNIKVPSLGVYGILGITLLSLISLFSSLFFNHGYFFNFTFLIIGLILILFFFKELFELKKQILILIIILSVLLIFITVSKNHDDFPYYHFPYISFLTEFSHPIGFGQFNNGFRSPSSIFFLSSMFYLPGIDIYLFHIACALILGFSNLILINLIFDKNLFNQSRYINFLSLMTFSFINIFFYRLAEHGTDKSGMILVMISIIFFIYLINSKKVFSNIDIMKFVIITICFVSTIKPFYLINLPIIFLFACYFNTRKDFLKLFFSKTFFYCLTLISLIIFYTFINSGCLVYPATFLCFENLPWSLNKDYINEVNIWFELWSKGGANPNFITEDKLNYISNFNWFANWMNNYFFNKISDFLIGISVLILTISFLFYKKKINNDYFQVKFSLVYIFIFLLFCEWFLKHPSLRYGGYHLIALLTLIPSSIILLKIDLNYNFFLKRTYIIIILTTLIFISRNGLRINDENNKYNYNPLITTNYQFIGGDKNFYFRYNQLFKEQKSKYSKINLLGKEIFITTFKN